ncbi:PP2C family serine/threonine-protein phosphatase [Streptomyces litchfieldiae]|uniref:PP2C family serine/threonine-protein phosphatase n=1 Tax=Streptomyces litchfieldiae TaxID=3075543 RepID=A0ABU2MUH2_9ACTN|nr:PP2C family serine/threonine-protein phosphatase [Streptomyces sp. DSM 44938]MDT0345287.1 PP2C family serine/threonine-protein phosphatase [Streptomyces sp. DSM 44938]
MSGAVNGGWYLLHQAVTGCGKAFCQDHHVAFTAAGGRAAVLAVADGHGSAPHFRSDLGARWAAEEFAACARCFVRRAEGGPGANDKPASLPTLRALARELPRQLVRGWRQRVALHEANAPAHGRRPETPAFDVYGTTLLGAVITGELLVCWQLGDGDIVLVDTAGRTDTPLDAGPDLGDETESLCLPEAWLRARLHWQPLTGGPPPAVLLSTDGLSKSFTDRGGFLAFARGVRERAGQEGPDQVQGKLADWLGHAATHSGDDTTLVGAIPVSPAGSDEGQQQ